MEENIKNDLVNYRISRAKETLVEVHAMIDLNFWNAAVSRLYYACYYGVTAVLLKNNVKAQTHAGVRQMFGLHFVQTGLVSRDLGKFYSTLFSKRHTGDYDDYVAYDKETLNDLLPLGIELIENLEQLIISS